jgi:hypothetical protein
LVVNKQIRTSMSLRTSVPDPLQALTANRDISRGIRRYTLATQADGSVIHWIRLAATGAERETSPAANSDEARLQPDALKTAQLRSRLSDLIHEQETVLLLLGLELEEPGLDLLPGFQLGWVHENPHALSTVFLIQGHGEPSEVDDFEPTVSDGALGQELYGIRQALGRLAEGIEELALRKVSLRKIDHEPPDHHARGHMAVEVLYHGDVFIK